MAALRVFAECRRWCEANVITFSALISACGACGEWTRALGVLEEMKWERVWPDVISYNAAITACANGEQWEAALRVFAECRQWYKADVITFNALISACGACG